jgi:hypothetical protein
MKRIAALLLVAGALTAAVATADAAVAAKPKPVTLLVVVGKRGVQGGPKTFTVKKGKRVLLVVRSALADEVHLHGYDIARDVRAGGTARIAFTARIPGRFEVELEDRGLPIALITVK